MGSQQAFEHESGFYNIRSIVLTTERNGLAGFTVHPMCPHAVIAVGILVAQKADYLQHTFSALFASDKPRSMPTMIAITPKPEPPMVAVSAPPLLRSCANPDSGWAKSQSNGKFASGQES